MVSVASNHIFPSALNYNFPSIVGGDKFTCLIPFLVEHPCTMNCARVLGRSFWTKFGHADSWMVNQLLSRTGAVEGRA